MAREESPEQQLLVKTLNKIGKDASLFRCEDKKIFSVEKVEISNMEKPSSGEKQTLSFNGRVWLIFKEPNGDLREDNYRFEGKIEVVNFNSFLGLKNDAFDCHR